MSYAERIMHGWNYRGGWRKLQDYVWWFHLTLPKAWRPGWETPVFCALTEAQLTEARRRAKERTKAYRGHSRMLRW